MAITLGLDAKLYRNTGSVSVPIWDLIPNVRDLTLSLEKNLADVTTRAALGWRQEVSVLKTAEVTFQMIWDGTDADFTAIRDAFLDNTQIYFAIMDGDITTTGNQGLTAWFEVPTFTRNEALEEALTVDVTLKLGFPPDITEQPIWFIVP